MSLEEIQQAVVAGGVAVSALLLTGLLYTIQRWRANARSPEASLPYIRLAQFTVTTILLGLAATTLATLSSWLEADGLLLRLGVGALLTAVGLLVWATIYLAWAELGKELLRIK